MGNRYDRSIDWSERVDNYKKKMDAYKGEREDYDAFYEKKLEKIPEIETPTSEEGNREEQLRKCKANKEKFLAFASKCHPPRAPCLRRLHQKAEAEETETRRK
jgi:hypothetical protein